MVRDGYKKTEIGVLPEDWELIKFEDCFELLPNNTLSRAELNYDFGDVRNIHYGDILMSFPSILNCSVIELPFINSGHIVKNNRSFLINGDVIIADTAEDETVGKATEVFGIETKKIVSGLHTIPCRPKVQFEPKWLGYFINHNVYHDQLLPFITGTKVSAISKSSIKETRIVKPSPKEQTAIAEALSDVDDLITSLEKLVEKKKAIKKGSMQELLTGNKRLPGFSGDWKTVKLGDVADIKDGTHQTPTYVESGIPFYSVETVSNNDFSHTKYITLAEHLRLTSSYKIEKGDVLMTRIGSLGVCKYIDWDVDASFYVSLALLKFKGNDLLAQYMSLLSDFEDFQKEIELNSLQYAIPMKINLGQISEVKIHIPSEQDEIHAIVDIIFDMNSEIQQLKNKIEKYRQLKQSMMSELLTGKIRLI